MRAYMMYRENFGLKKQRVVCVPPRQILVPGWGRATRRRRRRRRSRKRKRRKRRSRRGLLVYGSV